MQQFRVNQKHAKHLRRQHKLPLANAFKGNKIPSYCCCTCIYACSKIPINITTSMAQQWKYHTLKLVKSNKNLYHNRNKAEQHNNMSQQQQQYRWQNVSIYRMPLQDDESLNGSMLWMEFQFYEARVRMRAGNKWISKRDALRWKC